VTAGISFLSLSVPDKQKNRFTSASRVHTRRLEMVKLKVHFNYDNPLKYEMAAKSIEIFRYIIPVVFYVIGEGMGYVKTQLSLYPIYYADDDMFRSLWATFRSQKCIMRKTTQSMIIVQVHILNFQRDLVVGWIIHIELILSPTSIYTVHRV